MELKNVVPAHDTERVVSITRSWLGTPYHHQASVKGIGTDCLGLIRGVFRTLYGREAADVPAYSRDWAEAMQQETMLVAAAQHLCALPVQEAGAGDVVVFRFRRGAMAKHAAILTGCKTMIHAIEGAPVSEVALVGWWQRRIAGAFAFPGIIH